MSVSLRARSIASHGRANLRLALAHIVPVALIYLTASTSLAQSSVIVSIADGRETIHAGGSLVYTIALRSTETGSRTVNVRMHLPQYTNFLTASNGGQLVTNVIEWNNVTLSENTLRTLTVNLEVHPYAPLNYVLVAEAEVDGNRSTDTTRITQQQSISPISIKVSDGRETVEPKEELDYVIRVKNTGSNERSYNLRANMPEEANFVSATGDFIRRNGTLEWMTDTLDPGESEEYTVTVRVDEDAPGFYAIRFSASAEGAGERAVDLTYIHTGPIDADFDISVDADTNTARAGDEITYTITVENKSAVLATNVYVVDSLPPYTEYVDSTEGGLFVGDSEVRWDEITISPNGERVLEVTARVRSDVPEGFRLVNSAWVKDHRATATVEVGDSSNASNNGRNEIFLRKTVDRTEVRAGDTLTYTIYIRNTTDRVLRNLEVKDRFDNRYMSLLGGAEDAQMNGSEMLWNIGSLQPGEVWQKRYSLHVAANVPQGITLSNVVSVGGSDIAFLSLSERVRTANVQVFDHLPPTGAAMDTLFLGLTSILGAGQLFLTRRKILGA